MSTSRFTPRGYSLEDSVFHLFPQLPPELRLRVWQYSLPLRRIVPVRLRSTSQGERASSGRSSRGCVSSAHIPPHLHVCHEARTEALKQYNLSFGVCQEPGQIFFNPEDILYFEARNDQWETETQFRLFTSMVESKELACVRRVAINDAIFWPEPEYISSIASRLTVDILETVRRKLPNLEELVFVPRDGNSAYNGDATLTEPETPDLRLLRQIHEGMQVVARAHPEWSAPDWSVKVLSSSHQNDRLYEPHRRWQRPHPCGEMKGIGIDRPFGSIDEGVLRCFSGF